MNQSLIDTEKLLALLNEPTEVNDRPNAPDLIIKDGEIEFGKSFYVDITSSLTTIQTMSTSRMMDEVLLSTEFRSRFQKVPLWL